jgi:TPR repeat protein
MYRKGKGVTQDYVTAVKWYRKAADQGNASAQFNLGNMYRKGRGVTQDYVQAHMWYNLAVAGGLREPGKIRDLLSKQMTPEEIAEAQRMAREWKPIEK